MKYPMLVISQKTDFITKITGIENKIATDYDHDNYITTQEIKKLTLENFTARLKQANLTCKNDIANFVNKVYFNNILKNITSNKNEFIKKRFWAIKKS